LPKKKQGKYIFVLITIFLFLLIITLPTTMTTTTTTTAQLSKKVYQRPNYSKFKNANYAASDHAGLGGGQELS
jgi:flagellar basal body-associated protein FliL